MGRPSLLTPDRAEAIIKAVREGCSAHAAASKGAVDERTCLAWLARGRTERQRQAALDDNDHAPGTILPREVPYLQFLLAIEKAAAEWEAEALEAIRQAGIGEDAEETVVTETLGGWDGTTRNADGSPVLHVVGRTVVVKKRKQKAWQANAWLLERKLPDQYARVTKTELTGADGGPVEIESIDALREQATKVLDELATKRALRAGTAVAVVADDEIAEAEIVDDAAGQ